MIYIFVIAAIIVIPAQLGGYKAVFDAAEAAYRTKAAAPPPGILLGSNQKMAIAAKTEAKGTAVVPTLIIQRFPEWFAGFCCAAIALGALVPAAIMSIGAANIVTRNFWRPYISRNMTPKKEASVAKVSSLIVKFGALVFVVFLP